MSGMSGDTARSLDVHRTLVRTLDDGRVRISPAIKRNPSHRHTVQLHAREGERVLMNADSGRPHHYAISDGYGCSGTLLLRSLDVLDAKNVAIVDPHGRGTASICSLAALQE